MRLDDQPEADEEGQERPGQPRQQAADAVGGEGGGGEEGADDDQDDADEDRGAELKSSGSRIARQPMTIATMPIARSGL